MTNANMCSVCGTEFGRFVDPDGNRICKECGKDSPVLLHEHDNKEYLRKGEVVVDLDTGDGTYVWYAHGTKCFPLTEDEKEYILIKPEEVIDRVLNIVRSGKVRCTTCHKDISKDEVAGHPLFAGVNCDACWAKHQAMLEQQKRDGKVCLKCREPFGNCCC